LVQRVRRGITGGDFVSTMSKVDRRKTGRPGGAWTPQLENLGWEGGWEMEKPKIDKEKGNP